ncbi:sigma-70 family RNA polymerase sigma factor [Streptomyces sp. ISL-98]|uniref:sigma-70 family RNA polymerase sigma factor n=1 Tax=Streptomyces sp. ISL-98 TaxID=2819192 RepID=UPI001BE9E85A|nr:sigma-70 family RNA polymerase sigma factor [Streptomyces sp. ISL-98]MBT2506561.1 sigma-70 family RNA polymerase sigma factor [Streptomyces sp. ISL-98]
MAQGPVARGVEGGEPSLPIAHAAVPKTREPERGTIPPPRATVVSEEVRAQLDAELRALSSPIRQWIAQAGFGPHMDEIHSATLVRIFKARIKPGFIYSQGDEGRAFAWHATRLEILEFLRRKGKAREIPVDELPEPPVGRGDDPDTEAVLLRRSIRAFLAKYLPDKEREVYELRYLHDLKVGEIAAHLQIDRKTVSTRLRKAQELVDAARGELDLEG